MKMQACKDGHGWAVDDVKQAVRKPAQDSAPHIALDPLVERGIQRKMAFDAQQLVEEVDAQTRALAFVLVERGLDLDIRRRFVDDQRHSRDGRCSVAQQLPANLGQGDSRLIRMRPMVREPRPQLRPLLLGHRRRGLVVEDAVEQAVGDLKALARIEMLQLAEKGRFVHDMNVLLAARFSIGPAGATPVGVSG
jgi:hypothetical protein